MLSLLDSLSVILYPKIRTLYTAQLLIEWLTLVLVDAIIKLVKGIDNEEGGRDSVPS